MNDIQKQAKITELQARVMAVVVSVQGYIAMEGDRCSNREIVAAEEEIQALADELQKIAGG